MPYTIDDIMDKLEDVDVYTIITTETVSTPIVNDGHIGRDYIHKQANRQQFIPKEEYLKQQRERSEQCGGQENHRDNQKDCTCLAYGYTTHELHKLLNSMHTGDPKT